MAQGASSSRAQSAEPPNNAITQLNESLFELHKPIGRPSMVVLFFHGFQHGNYENAHLTAWKTAAADGSSTANENFPCSKKLKTEDGSSTWLQTWLVDDDQYPDAHILSVAYNANLMKSKERGSFDLYIIGENIISDLLQANIAQDPQCPIVLVGHSFGGLVVKEVCVQAHKRGSMGSSKHKTFLENIKGAFFYSTPHHGISGEISEYFVSKRNEPLLEYVKVLSTCAARLHEDFDKVRKQCAWQTAGVGEALFTHLSTFRKQVIVPEGSSRYGDAFVIVPDADHISICRPISKISRPFTSLSSFLRGVSTTWERPVRPHNHQSLPKSTIGIDNVMKELKQQLTTVTSLGLSGMGGIGKTTMAKALFNDIEHLYEYTCYVGDVKNSEHEVEDMVLRNMHRRGKKFTEKDGGLVFFRGKQLLLFLDDVASEKHMRLLSTLIDDIGIHEDSRFVVTSRDREVLEQCLDAVHPMRFLSQGDARKLFLAHAVRQEPSPSFEEHIDIVVRKCSGLALTLEVIGKHLYKKPMAIWREAISILDRAETVRGFDEKLWRKLRISFDGLDLKEKHMFLDCATVFHRAEIVMAKAAWSITTNGLEETLWQHLLDLSLVWEIRVASYMTCGMHEQLLSLGRKIASDEVEHGLRIWDNLERDFLLLSAQNGTENDVKDIVAISVDGVSGSVLHLNYEESVTLVNTGDTKNRTQPETSTAETSTGVVHKYVSCDECSVEPIQGPRFQSIVQDDYDLCGRCFEKGGHRTDEYDRIDLPIDYRAIIKGGGARVQSHSDEDCLLPCLDEGKIPGHYEDLATVEGSTFCKMRNLRYLGLAHIAIDQTHCATLPSTLVYLRMDGVQFSVFPFRPSDHQRMAILRIGSCRGLRALPTAFGLLSSLQHLHILWAPNLKSLPDSLGSLRKLVTLWLEDCSSLAELPQTFGQLVALERLSIDYCDALSALPKSFGYLPKLRTLCIRGCRRLHILPDTFLELQRLESLNLDRTYLQSIPNLENLRSLKDLDVHQDVPRIRIHSLSDLMRWKAESESREVEEETGHEES